MSRSDIRSPNGENFTTMTQCFGYGCVQRFFVLKRVVLSTVKLWNAENVDSSSPCKFQCPLVSNGLQIPVASLVDLAKRCHTFLPALSQSAFTRHVGDLTQR